MANRPSKAKERRLMVGEGGCDDAGENTPTPDNFKLFSSEVKYSRGEDPSGVVSFNED